MSEPMGIAVLGASGRMGRMLTDAVLENPACRLGAATVRPGHPWAGQDLGLARGGPALGVIVTDDPIEAFVRVQAALDFTTPDALPLHAELAAQARLTLVVGTTGLGPAHLARLAAAGWHAVIVRASNTSVGVTLLAAMARRMAAVLGPGFDVEIVEMHHRMKVDAPSGTALIFGEAVAAGRGVTLADVAERGRDGLTGPRADGAIGFASLRGGDVVGEHEVIFAGPGERLTLRHVATDRMLFARGAVRAALWGAGREPGEYGMVDVLGLGDAD